MKLYTKLKSAELDSLLLLRDLPIDGPKIQKIARLLKQDEEEKAGVKAVNDKVREVSMLPDAFGSGGGSAITSATAATATATTTTTAVAGGRDAGMLGGAGDTRDLRRGITKGKRKAPMRKKEAMTRARGMPAVQEAVDRKEMVHDGSEVIEALANGLPCPAARKQRKGTDITVNLTRESRGHARGGRVLKGGRGNDMQMLQVDMDVASQAIAIGICTGLVVGGLTVGLVIFYWLK